MANKTKRFKKIIDLINNVDIVEKIYEKIESQKEDYVNECVEDYLSALTAIVLMCPSFKQFIEDKERLFEVGKNLFFDSIDTESQIPGTGSKNPMFLALYMKVLFPKKFDKVYRARKKFYNDWLGDIMAIRVDRLEFGYWEIATAIKILMPEFMENTAYSKWFDDWPVLEEGNNNGEWYGLYELSEAIGLTTEQNLFKINVPQKWLTKTLEEEEKFITEELVNKDSIDEISQGLWRLFNIKRIVDALPSINLITK